MKSRASCSCSAVSTHPDVTVASVLEVACPGCESRPLFS
jgi:hypothetical protein